MAWISVLRMAKTEPWEHYPSIWKTKGAFFVYLRGHLRLLWSRYPAKIEWKKSKMVKPPVGYTGRAKTLGKCHYCNEMFAASHLEVDHVQQAGACSSWETANQFLHNLLDCNDNWVLACKPCHKVKSYAEKEGISFEEAAVAKKVIEVTKQPVKKVLDWLAERGYNGASVGNATKRKELVTKLIKGEVNV